jgi:hypothetical protein
MRGSLQMDETLRAIHEIQSEDAAARPDVHAPGAASQAGAGLLGILAAWLQATVARLAGVVASIEAAIFTFAKSCEHCQPSAGCASAFNAALCTSAALPSTGGACTGADLGLSTLLCLPFCIACSAGKHPRGLPSHAGAPGPGRQPAAARAPAALLLHHVW